MATGWAGDNAVNEQIDATVKDGIRSARSRLPQGRSLSQCANCGAAIPEARRTAVPGVRLCIACQESDDQDRSRRASLLHSPHGSLKTERSKCIAATNGVETRIDSPP